MTKQTFLQHSLTEKEQIWGWRYLLFQLCFLSIFIRSFNWLFWGAMTPVQSNFIYFCINFAAVLVIFHRFLKQFLTVEWEQIGRILLFFLLLFGLYEIINWSLGWLLQQIDPHFSNINDESIAQLTNQNFYIMLLGTVIAVPVAEETLYRGLLFRGLYSRSPLAAWIISVATFALIHIVNYIGVYPPATLALCYLQYIPAGIILAAAYRWTGSIFTPMLIHAAVNLLGILILR